MTTYNVLEKLKINVSVTENPYNFELNQLFDLAMRINKKRSFLFVSKVLGKHLAVAPQTPILTGYLLAHRFLEVRQKQQQQTTPPLVYALQQQTALSQTMALLQEKPLHSEKPLLIIGFAETATALGHAFFHAFTGDVRYVHTTRELLVETAPILSFEEEHSHATSHRLYGEPALFEQVEEIVLVDDEMTTGQTNRNIIEQLHAAYPHIQTVTLVSILDWRDEEQEQATYALAKKLGITIHTVSLLKGQFDVTELGELAALAAQSAPRNIELPPFLTIASPDVVAYRSLDADGQQHKANYFKGSGRFALDPQQQRSYSAWCEQVGEQLKARRTGKTSLLLGTGEFMFVPMLIAAHMGEGVSYHSTTRSPIFAHPDSLICTKHIFESPEYPGVMNYLYNIPNGKYDDIFLLFERILDEGALVRLVSQLRPLTNNVHIITIGGEVNDEV